jgi:hypothetical protein
MKRWAIISFAVLVASLACTDTLNPVSRATPTGSTISELGVSYPLITILQVPSSAAVGSRIQVRANIQMAADSAVRPCSTCSWHSTDSAVANTLHENDGWGSAAGDFDTLVVLAAGSTDVIVSNYHTAGGPSPVGLTATSGSGGSNPNLPAGYTIVCQTGNVTSISPMPCGFSQNGGTGSIALAPNGGWRITLPAGAVNDAAIDMSFSHKVSGTGSYYIDWKQRWQDFGSYAALKTAMNSEDSKAWAPKGPNGDLTIMSWMDSPNFGPDVPVIGLNFQGADGHNIPDVNGSGGSGTTPVTSAWTLPSVLANNGGWDEETILIQSTGNLATSTVTFWVNGTLAGMATGVTNATAWTSTHQYLSRSVYSGVQKTTVWTDINDVTIAVK